jgi:hypothetical protein
MESANIFEIMFSFTDEGLHTLLLVRGN